MNEVLGETVTVEGATEEDDIARINDFFNSNTIKQELHRFTYRTTLDRAFDREDRRLLYIENEGAIVGALMVWCESRVLDDEEAQIRLVAVSPDYRERGVAAKLCGRAEVFAADQGQEWISADVARDSPAVDFWTSIGYEVDYKWETDGGREMYRMMKSLSTLV